MKRDYKKHKQANVKINKDMEVVLASATMGRLVFSSDKMERKIDFEFSQYDYFTMSELYVIAKESPRLLEHAHMLIVDVLEDDITIKDIYTHLNMEGTYKALLEIVEAEDNISTDMFVKFAKARKSETIAKTLQKKNAQVVKERIQEGMARLKKGGLYTEFESYKKMQVLADSKGKDVNEMVEDMELVADGQEVDLKEYV